jgi:hypothetical protein
MQQYAQMPGETEKKGRWGVLPKGHRFFLNPYKDCAFTKCPKCDRKTVVRKVPLVIHIEPKQMFVLNKQCKYCAFCDLIIVKQADLEALMAATFEKRDASIIGNEYLVIGTLSREDWRRRDQIPTPRETLDRTRVFRDVWKFEITGGWQLDPKARMVRRQRRR